MRIVLVGPRGAGKTTLAGLLGLSLGFPVISTDALIEKKAGTTVSEIVKEQGWDGFRQIEEQVVSAIAKQDDCILDCGGGVVLSERNRNSLKETVGWVIYLTGDAATLAGRISGDARRPALTQENDPADEMEKVLTLRDPLYRAIADRIIDTVHLSPEEISSEILRDLC